MVAEENDAEHEHGDIRDQEAAIFQKAQFNDGVLMIPLPEEGEDETERGEQAPGDDEGGGEPVVALAFIEDHLKSSKTEGDGGESDVIDADSGLAVAAQIRRVFTSLFVSSREMMPTGMLMKKIQRQS